MGQYRDELASFTLAAIPTLDRVVLGALELFGETSVQPIDIHTLGKSLVLGSGNAFQMAKIIFGEQAHYGDEATFRQQLAHFEHYDTVVVASASGMKHAVPMVEAGKETGLRTVLITNNADSPAAAALDASDVLVFPKNREPYTYNTSTYLGPIISANGESPADIATFITTQVQPRLLRNFEDYTAFTLIIPSRFEPVREMLRTKFDELFGPTVVGRVFTEEEIKHAKTVVRSGCELFIGFGVTNEHYGLQRNRLTIPLPEGAAHGTLIAVSYYVVGKIQAAMPPYFQENIADYCKLASEIFGQELNPIVE